MALTEKNTLMLEGPDGEVHLEVDPKDDWLFFRVGKESRRVKRVDLWAAVFAMSDAEQQDKLMPVRQTEMMTFEKIHQVVAKKDIKKGDKLTVKCQMNVPLTVVESLKGLVEKNARKSPTHIPIIGA